MSRFLLFRCATKTWTCFLSAPSHSSLCWEKTIHAPLHALSPFTIFVENRSLCCATAIVSETSALKPAPTRVLLQILRSKADSSAVCWEWLLPALGSRSFLSWLLTATRAAVTCASVTRKLPARSLPLSCAHEVSIAFNRLFCLVSKVVRQNFAEGKGLSPLGPRQDRLLRGIERHIVFPLCTSVKRRQRTIACSPLIGSDANI